MDPPSGFTKILRTRARPTNAEGEHMDVDQEQPAIVSNEPPTNPSAMDVTPAEPAPAPTEVPAADSEPQVAAAAPPVVVQPTAEELRLMRLRRFGAAPSSTEASPAPANTPAKATSAAVSSPSRPNTVERSVAASTPTSVETTPTHGTHTHAQRLTPTATPFNTPSNTPIETILVPMSPPAKATPSPAAAHTPTHAISPSSASPLASGAHTPQSAQPFDIHAWINKAITSSFSVRSLAGPVSASAISSFGSPDSNTSKGHVWDMASIITQRASTDSNAASVKRPTSPNDMDVTEKVAAPTAGSSQFFIVDDVDLILMNILSTPSAKAPHHFNFFEYLAHCLNRISSLRSVSPATHVTIPASPSASALSDPATILSELTTRTINFFALALVNPSIFPLFSAQLMENPEYATTQFVKVLGKSNLLSKEQLTQLVLTIPEGDDRKRVFEAAFLRCAALCRMGGAQVQFDAAAQAPVHAFRMMVSIEPLVAILVQHPRWTVKPKDTGKQVDLTLLGCIMSFTPLFSITRTETEGAMVALPTGVINEILFEIMTKKSSKEAALDWIATVIMKNKDSTKMGAGETLSSTGFANSFSSAMLRLSKGFSKRTQDLNRYANFDPDYFTRSKRLGALFDSSETRITADKTAFEAHKNSFAATEVYTPTFNTECFHMTLMSLIQQNRIYLIYADIFERLADQKRRGAQDPQADKMERVKAVIEDVIFAPAHFTEAFLFWEMVAIWLARAATTPEGQPLSGSTQFDPPMAPSPPSNAYQCLPELILESMCNYFIFAAMYWEKFPDQVHSDIMHAIVSLLMSPAYVKNPHIRVKLVKVLTTLMPHNKQGGHLKPSRTSPFDSNFVVANLGPALTHLYVDVERTGSASQFYDRLNARHEMSSILIFLWNERPGHKESIVAFWKHHNETFKSFADKLLNDMIYLLDEGLSKLLESRGALQRLSSGTLSATETRELRETEDRALRNSRSYMVLLKESLRIFSMVAISHPHLFLQAGMHERLATSLNYCLYQIHGPRRNELKFQNQERYEFEPVWVVDKLCSSITSFALAEHGFVEYLSKDTRSYSDDLYMQAAAFLEQHAFPDAEFRPSAWRQVAQMARDQTHEVEMMEDELGEIPDEFLDPLMATLMRDPVILPSSRVTLDRSVIERALLADPIDPYNRSPLTPAELIPDVDLKKKIDSFIADKRTKKQSS